jgi:hypothetical protein
MGGSLMKKIVNKATPIVGRSLVLTGAMQCEVECKGFVERIKYTWLHIKLAFLSIVNNGYVTEETMSFNLGEEQAKQLAISLTEKAIYPKGRPVKFRRHDDPSK